MKPEHVQYAASVAFALMAAFLVGTKGAALACMFAWAAAYAGMYCSVLHEAKDEFASTVGLVSIVLTVVAAATMVVAFLLSI